MRLLLIIITLFHCLIAQADSIASYMKIANNIPKMEIQADPKSQALARSSRNVLIITTEAIAETMLQANDIAKQKGAPLFCLPKGMKLDASSMDALIKKGAQKLRVSAKEQSSISVSKIAWDEVISEYSCQNKIAMSNRMAHVVAALGH